MDLQHKIEVNFAKFLWHPRLVQSHSQSYQLVLGGQSWSKWKDLNQFSVINQWYDAQSKGLEHVLEYEKFFLVVVFLFIGNPSYLMYGRIGLYCSWLWLTLFIDNDKQRIMYRHEGEEQRPVCHVSARTIWEDCPSVCRRLSVSLLFPPSLPTWQRSINVSCNYLHFHNIERFYIMKDFG